MPGKTLEVRGTDPLRRGRGGSEIGRPSVSESAVLGAPKHRDSFSFARQTQNLPVFRGRGETGSRRVSFPSIGTVRAQKMSSRHCDRVQIHCERATAKEEQTGKK